jgi:NADPH-dependent curcumin reductase CurA
MLQINRQWIFSQVPGPGPIKSSCFDYQENNLCELKEGEYLVKNKLLSFDPTQRMWMQADTYVPKIPLGSVMRSLALGEVIKSKNKKIKEGTRLTGLFGWQEYSIRTGHDFFPDVHVPEGVSDEAAMSVFGLTGLTAYFGMKTIGHVKKGDAVLVSGASGATGSVAAQIARLEGASKVIGIAGGQKKCDWLREKAKLDEVIDYKSESILDQIKKYAPEGIDLFFDNVGGATLDAALLNLRLGARVVLCGAISAYEGTSDPAIRNYMSLVLKRASMRGFLFSDHLHLMEEAILKLGSWVESGELCFEVDLQSGLENAPETLQRLFDGKNFGKQLLKI